MTKTKITGENAVKLLNSPKFRDWLFSFDLKLKIVSIEEGWSHWTRKGELIFALLHVRYLDDSGDERGSVVFFRSDSVTVFLVVRDADIGERYVVLTEQIRVPAGGKILETPAGSVEDDGDALATAVREIEEEVGLKIKEQDLVPLGQYFLSPGACNEKMDFYSCELRLSSKEIQSLQDRLAGLRSQGEKIQVKLYSLEYFETLDITDAKTQLAYALYLRRGKGK